MYFRRCLRGAGSSLSSYRKIIRCFSGSGSLRSQSMKVSILGATSETGTFLSLLLKRSFLIDELCVYGQEDDTQYLEWELNQIDTKCKVTSHPRDQECLRKTLEDAKVVVFVAGKNQLQGDSTPAQLLESNAEILSDFVPCVVRSCPRAMLAIAMQPVNSLVPIVVEMYKTAGVYEYKRIFGVSTLDGVRANTFAAEMIGVPPECAMVPVIGGCCPRTRVPLFSRMIPRVCLPLEKLRYLTESVRKADEEVLNANGGTKSSIYAFAFAIGRFCISLCKAVRQRSEVVECAYVRSCVVPELTYFASPLQLGPDGIQKYLTIPPLNELESSLLQEAIPALREAITQGEILALGSNAVSTEICPVYLDVPNRSPDPPHIRRT